MLSIVKAEGMPLWANVVCFLLCPSVVCSDCDLSSCDALIFTRCRA